MADEREADPRSGQAPPPRPHGGNGALGDRPERDLAYPGESGGHDGTRCCARLGGTQAGGAGPAQPVGSEAGKAGGLDEAFISPSDPIVRAMSRIAPDAVISPDEPILDLGPEGGEVTGIGNDPHLEETDPASPRYTDSAVAGLVLQVGRLADALCGHGEAGLQITADMSRFEATLRAYCVGYLVAQRATEEE